MKCVCGFRISILKSVRLAQQLFLQVALLFVYLFMFGGCSAVLNYASLKEPASDGEVNVAPLSLAFPQVGSIIRTPTFSASGECPESIVQIRLVGDVENSPQVTSCANSSFAFSNVALLKDGDNEIIVEGYDSLSRLVGQGRFVATKDVATLKVTLPKGTSIATGSLSSREFGGECSWQGASVKLYYDQNAPQARLLMGTANCDAEYKWSLTADVSDFDASLNGGSFKLYVEEWNQAEVSVTGELITLFTLDADPPVATGIRISAANVDTVNSNDVQAFPVVSGADEMYFTTVAGCASGGTWETLASSKTVHLDISGGVNRVYAKFRDYAGNVSACVSSIDLTLKSGDVVLSSHFPGYRNWFSFVTRPGAGASYMDVTPNSCSSGWSNMPGCVHAGALKKVHVPSINSCTGVSATDLLGVFEWDCIDYGGNGTIVVRSTGLKPNKGLRDLVTESGWRANAVTIVTPSHTYQTVSEAWWAEDVLPLPDNASTALENLSATRTIYVLGSNRSTRGYRITADYVGIAIVPGAILSFAAGGPNNCARNSYDIESSLTAHCVVYSWGPKWAWIEGDIDAGAAQYGVNFVYSNYNRLRNVRIRNGGMSFQDNWSDGMMVEHSHFENATNIDYTIGFGLFLHDVTFSNFSGTVGSWFAHNQIWTNVRFINVGSGTSFAWNNFGGIGSIMSHASFINSAGGIQLGYGNSTNGYENTFNQILMLNTGTAFQVRAHDNRVSQIAVSGSEKAFEFSEQGNDLKVYNNLLFDNVAGECTGTPTNSQIASGSCALQNGSTAQLITGANSLTSIVGKVTVGDAMNGSDTNGTATYSTSLDFWNFTNIFRGWGLDGGAFPNSNNRGKCSSGTCRIWDLTINASDTVLRNRSGNGTSDNEDFIVGAACPSAVDGSKTITDGMGHTLLINAIEIRSDGIGDDNGLCESREACIYSPHYGAYQGSGEYRNRECIFHDGTVQGVRMYGYPNL